MAKRYNDFTRGDVRGVAQAVKALEEIGVNVVKAAKAALKQGVNTITEDAKNRVPVYNGLLFILLYQIYQEYVVMIMN